MAATRGSLQTFVRYYQKTMIDMFSIKTPIRNINVRLKYLSYSKMLKVVPFPLLVTKIIFTTNNCLANK